MSLFKIKKKTMTVTVRKSDLSVTLTLISLNENKEIIVQRSIFCTQCRELSITPVRVHHCPPRSCSNLRSLSSSSFKTKRGQKDHIVFVHRLQINQINEYLNLCLAVYGIFLELRKKMLQPMNSQRGLQDDSTSADSF